MTRAEYIKVPMMAGWTFAAEVDEQGYLNIVVHHDSGEEVRAMVSEGYENEDGRFMARLGTVSEIQQNNLKKRNHRKKKE